MITIKQLKEMLQNFPDEAEVSAYEGEDIGLSIQLGEKYGWIRTGIPEEKTNIKYELLQ